jgi:SSS family solute:Na+ symporter
MILLSLALCAFAVAGLYASAQAARDANSAHRQVDRGVLAGALAATFAMTTLFTAPFFARAAGYPGASVALVAVTLPLGALALTPRLWVLARLAGAQSVGELIAASYGRTAAILAGVIALVAAVGALTQILVLAGGLTDSFTAGAIDPRHGLYFAAAFLALTAVPAGLAAAARLARLHAFLFAVGALAIAILVVAELHGVGGAIEALGRAGEAIGGTTSGHGGGDYPAGNAIAGLLGEQAGWGSLDTLGAQLEIGGSLLALVWLPWVAASRDPRPLGRPSALLATLGAGALMMLVTYLLGLAALTLRTGPANPASLMAALFDPPGAAALLALAAAAALHAFALGVIAGAISFLRPLWAHRRPGGAHRDLAVARGITLLLIVVALLAALLQPQELALTLVGAWHAAALLALLLAALCLAPALSGSALTIGLLVGAGLAIWSGGLVGIAFMLVATLVLQSVRPRDKRRDERVKRHAAAGERLGIGQEEPRRGPLALGLGLVWLFFAAGPGAVLGNDLFGAPDLAHARWEFALPSLGVWEIGSWLAGAALLVYVASTLVQGRLTRDEWERLSRGE